MSRAQLNIVAVLQVTRSHSQGKGTGFLIRMDGTIATCAHVLAGASMVSAIFRDPTGERAFESLCRLVDLHVANDVALIRAQRPLPEWLRPEAKLATSDITVSETQPSVTVACASLGYPPFLTPAKVAQVMNAQDAKDRDGTRLVKGEINLLHLLADGVTNGASGGPVFDEGGAVVGMVAAGPDRGHASMAFAVPVSAIRGLKANKEPKQFGVATTSEEGLYSPSGLSKDDPVPGRIEGIATTDLQRLWSRRVGEFRPNAMGLIFGQPAESINFGSGEHSELLKDVSAAGTYSHFLNPTYGFNFVATKGTPVEESFFGQPDICSLRTIIGSGQDWKKMRIYAKRVPVECECDECRLKLFQEWWEKTVRVFMEAKIVPIPELLRPDDPKTITWIQPPYDEGCPGCEDCGGTPWATRIAHLGAHPATDRAYLIKLVVSGDTVVGGYMTYRPSDIRAGGELIRRSLERLVTVASLEIVNGEGGPLPDGACGRK